MAPSGAAAIRRPALVGAAVVAVTVTLAVTQVPNDVAIGQIFQAAPAPSKPLLELQYVKGGTLRPLAVTVPALRRLDRSLCRRTSAVHGG